MPACQYERGRGWVLACRQPATHPEPSAVNEDGVVYGCDAHKGLVDASIRGE